MTFSPYTPRPHTYFTPYIYLSPPHDPHATHTLERTRGQAIYHSITHAGSPSLLTAAHPAVLFSRVHMTHRHPLLSHPLTPRNTIDHTRTSRSCPFDVGSLSCDLQRSRALALLGTSQLVCFLQHHSWPHLLSLLLILAFAGLHRLSALGLFATPVYGLFASRSGLGLFASRSWAIRLPIRSWALRLPVLGSSPPDSIWAIRLPFLGYSPPDSVLGSSPPGLGSSPLGSALGSPVFLALSSIGLLLSLSPLL